MLQPRQKVRENALFSLDSCSTMFVVVGGAVLEDRGIGTIDRDSVRVSGGRLDDRGNIDAHSGY